MNEDEWVDVETSDDEWVDVDTGGDQNIFEKIVNQSRDSGMQGNFIPTNKDEALDFGKVLLRQFVPDQPGLVGLGAEMATGKKVEGLPSPETQFGSNLENAANMAQLSHLAMALGPAVKNTAKNMKGILKNPKINPVIAESNLDVAADQTAIRARETFKKFSGELSQAYGKDYEEAIGGAQIKLSDYADALDNAISETGIRGKEDRLLSPAEKKVLAYVDDLRTKIPQQNPIDTLLNKQDDAPEAFKSVKDVDQELKGLLGKAFGKQYGSGEHILTVVRKNVADMLGDAGGKIKIVKAKYTEPLRMKSEAYKVLQPYNKSGNFDTTRATDLLKRASLGDVKPDEKRLLDALSGYEPGLLDDLMAKGKDFSGAKLINGMLFPRSPLAQGAAGAAGAGIAYGGYQLLKKFLS